MTLTPQPTLAPRPGCCVTPETIKQRVGFHLRFCAAIKCVSFTFSELILLSERVIWFE